MKFARDDSVRTTSYAIEGVKDFRVAIIEMPTSTEVWLREVGKDEAHLMFTYSCGKPKTHNELLAIANEIFDYVRLEMRLEDRRDTIRRVFGL